MIAFFIKTPQEMTQQIAKQMQAKRLSLNLTQKTLAQRCGVSLGVLKKFERTGQISLASLLKIALPLNSLEEFQALFKPLPPERFASLDALLADKPRKRGRQ